MIFPTFSCSGSAHQRIFQTVPGEALPPALAGLLPSEHKNVTANASSDLGLDQEVRDDLQKPEEQKGSTERKKQLQEDVEHLQEERKQFNFHDVYMNYLRKVLPEQGGEKWFGADATVSHPEYIAGDGDANTNWLLKGGRLVSGLLEDVLAPSIPLQGTIRINNLKVSGAELIKALQELTYPTAALPPQIQTQVDAISTYTPGFDATIALQWVKEMEDYVWDFTKEEGLEAQRRAQMQNAHELLNREEQNFLAEAAGEEWEKFQNGIATGNIGEIASPVIKAFLLYKLWKAAPSNAKLAVFAGYGLYELDKLQAQTDLFGGQRFFDWVTNGDIAELRATPIGAFLNEQGRTTQLDQKAGLLMSEIPVDELLDWNEKVLAAKKQADVHPQEGSPSHLYYSNMPKLLTRNFNKLFPEYKDMDSRQNFRAAEVLWEIWQEFLIRSGKKARKIDDTIAATPGNGAEYLKARYTGWKINDKYQQFRDSVGALQEDYSKNPPTFSRVLVHEMPRIDLYRSIADNQTLQENITMYLGEQWLYLVEIIDETVDFTVEEWRKLRLWVETAGLQKGSLLVQAIKQYGYKIALNSSNWAKREITLIYQSKSFQLLKNGAIWAWKAPFETGSWILETTEENLPKLLEYGRHISMNYVKPWIETLTNMRGPEKKETINDGQKLYDTLIAMGIDENVQEAYGLISTDDLLALCQELVDNSNTFVKLINEFRGPENTAKTYDAEQMHGNYTGSEQLTHGEIARLFLVSSLGTAKAADFMVNAGISLERGVVNITDFLTEVAFSGVIMTSRVVTFGGVVLTSWTPELMRLRSKARAGVQALRIKHVNISSAESLTQVNKVVEDTDSIWNLEKLEKIGERQFDVVASTTSPFNTYPIEKIEFARRIFLDKIADVGYVDGLIIAGGRSVRGVQTQLAGEALRILLTV